ncbi:MAG: phosphoribosylformylglycinamidine synthase subunit PurQ [Planctomycetes bacterium]|nr:phosphoribosylformylglycinamidine synthase subunit PurQ [Planctomycetota bacterium]
MSQINVLVLRAAGTNCDLESQHAWELAGVRADRVHLRRLIEQPAMLDQYQIVTLPGGFSYGDDIAAGRIFAAQLRRHLVDQLRAFVDAGKLVLGICNGFQILVQARLLPYPHGTESAAEKGGGGAICTVTYNDPPGFQDRWVTLFAHDSPCVFTEPGRTYEMPIAHGEGRVVFVDGRSLERVIEARQNALCYVPPGVRSEEAVAMANEANWLGGRDEAPATDTPYNPNGSHADIAGLCDTTGRVLGLMPHPERFVTRTQHPCWTSQPNRETGDGLAMFQRAVEYFR